MRISLSAAWDETKQVIARDGRLVVAVALAMLVLPGVIMDISMPEAEPGKFPPPGPWIAVAAAALAISLAGQLAIIRLALGRGTSVGDAIVHGFRRLLPYVAALLVWLGPLILIGGWLYGAAEVNSDTPRGAPAFGFLLVVMAAMFLAFRLLLSSAVASAESIGPRGILERSWALGKGNWWRLFAFAILFAITLIILLGAIQAVVGTALAAAAGGIRPWSLGALLLSLISQTVSAAVSAIFFVMLARMYRQVAGDGAAPASAPKSGT